MTTRKLTIMMKNQHNEKFSRVISYANADATDAVLFEFATRFCNLSENTLISVYKDDTTPVTGE